MALYEYRCNACSETFELLRPMADRELRAMCPSCESPTTMPLISRVAISVGSASRADSAPAPRSGGGGGGGCCGGACGCG
jgi:putative FmdB family regulatory protein